MKKTLKKVIKEYPVYLTIHGHFYQPPRENPWTNTIEKQDSASPFHDWNERINNECYRPNSMSRILGSSGKISNIINNFEYLSFNIGPTLLSWMEQNDYQTYKRILEADKKSMEKNNGHGNAIAQVYNHIIMPLANNYDKETQIIWGITDFEHRFKRKPEGMWLAETAINRETVNLMIEHGLKFTILAPTQAYRIREFGGAWKDASSSNFDPKKPYRLYYQDNKGKKDEKRYLDIFFYDGPISSSVAFEHLLRDASAFAGKLSSAINPDKSQPQLVHIGTDGESYGHHESFGDMCLAYLFSSEAKNRGFTVTNYANYLEMFPPTEEVELKNYDNEGTAWSCSHGVGRWYKDCGCTTGGQPEWNQRWREPLRESLNELRDSLLEIYLMQSEPLLKSPIEARNDYIKIIMDRSEESIENFIKKHAKKKLSKKETTTILKLLEGQHNALLMFTSCAWFFCEISGIETVQVIKYAARAIQLYRDFTKLDLETRFINTIKAAKSNISEENNGDKIYLNWIKPYIITLKKLAVQYCAIDSIFEIPNESDIAFYHIKVNEKKEINTIKAFDLTITDNLIKESSNITVVLNQNNDKHSYSVIDGSITLTESNLLKNIKEVKELEYETLSILNETIIDKHIRSRLYSLNGNFITMFQELKPTLLASKQLKLKLPYQFKFIFENAFKSIAVNSFNKDAETFNHDNFDELFELYDLAKLHNIEIEKKYAQKTLGNTLTKMMIELENKYSEESILKIKSLFDIADKLEVDPDTLTAQNTMLKIINKQIKPMVENITDINKNMDKFFMLNNMISLAEKIGFDVIPYKNTLIDKLNIFK